MEKKHISSKQAAASAAVTTKNERGKGCQTDSYTHSIYHHSNALRVCSGHNEIRKIIIK